MADPWFDRLTTLSEVEGESSAVSRPYVSGCRIKSSMTLGIHALLLNCDTDCQAGPYITEDFFQNKSAVYQASGVAEL